MWIGLFITFVIWGHCNPQSFPQETPALGAAWVGLEGTKQFHVQVFLLFRCTSSVALGLGQPGGWIFPLEVIFKEIFTIGSFCFDHWHQRHPHPFRPCAVLVLPQHFHLLSHSPAFPHISQSFCPCSAPP